VIDREDLQAAVAAGTVTEAQAASLIALAESRQNAREGLRDIDEPFELFRGFNEIFIVTGLGILSLGWGGFVIAFNLSEVPNAIGTRMAFFGLLGAVILAALSYYFIRRRRMVAPAIALSILFAANAFLATFAARLENVLGVSNSAEAALWPTIAALVAVAVHWVFFRVPFSLAMLAVGLFAACMIGASLTSGTTPEAWHDIFRLSGFGPFGWTTLVLGALTFAAALRFDLSDPYRVTRRSSNGFWLHLVAAPMLVNTVAVTLLSQNSGIGQAVLAGFLFCVALIAVIIDRRSFLIAGAGYIVFLIQSITGNPQSLALIVLGLGVVLLTLGAYWDRIRAAILAPLSGVLPLDKLPPANLKVRT